MESEPGVREPRRVVVASYGSYPEAQRAVDYLSDERFPVERVAIVAEDLRLVEQVTGRRGYGQAALQGAGSGALIGLIFGFFLGLFNVFDPLVSALSLGIVWLIYGAIIGLIVGLIGHALSGGQRDFSSIGGIQANRYNVMADEEVADEASRLLTGLRDVRSTTTTERSPRMGEEAVPPSREDVSPERQRTGEAPLSEERPGRREVPPSADTPREGPPPGEERPERRGVVPSTDTTREAPPPGEERPERRTP
jgi:hypothetical protein